MATEAHRLIEDAHLIRATLELFDVIAASDQQLPIAELHAMNASFREANFDLSNLNQRAIGKAAETLVVCLSSASRPVRKSAVRLLRVLLARASDPRLMQRLVPPLIERLRHHDWGVRCAALECLKPLSGLIDAASLAVLIEQLQHPTDWGLRQVALEALALLDSDALATVAVQMLALLERLNWEERRGALRLMAEVLSPGSLAPLASTIYGMRELIGADVDYLLGPAAASMVAVHVD